MKAGDAHLLYNKLSTPDFGWCGNPQQINP